MALVPEGIQAAFRMVKAVGKLALRVFVKDVLSPTLRPGHVVAVDHLSVHHGPAVRAAIEARECLLIHLPARSPDFAPIERAFSKVKAKLRQIGARTQETRDTAIGTTLDTISPEDAQGFFGHSGYLLPVQT